MATVHQRFHIAMSNGTLTPGDALWHLQKLLRDHCPVGEPLERYWDGVLTEIERPGNQRREEETR